MMEGVDGRPAFADVSLKPWCAARQTMAATQAACACVAAGVVLDEVTEITAAVLPPHFKMINHGVKPGDRASFMTSLPYQIAAALLQPEKQFDLSPPAEAPPPAVQALMARITVSADDALLADYPFEWRARVTMATAQGPCEQLVRHIPGDPALPMGKAAVANKFQRLIAPAVNRSTGDALWDAALHVVDAAEQRERLFGELGAILARAG